MPLQVGFIAGTRGMWQIDRIVSVAGASLPTAERLHVVEGDVMREPGDETWALHGSTSNIRYSTRQELDSLASRQEDLRRPQSVCAALIPIRKSAAWWDLAQDERREIFEEQSRHIAVGMEYLPQIARRLHHCREMNEPFDFLTWFEFAPEHEAAFDHMLGRLRDSMEWRFVEREVEVRVRQ